MSLHPVTIGKYEMGDHGRPAAIMVLFQEKPAATGALFHRMSKEACQLPLGCCVKTCSYGSNERVGTNDTFMGV